MKDSDYKILYSHSHGKKRWEVYYKDRELGIGACTRLDEAQERIRSHKEWVQEAADNNSQKWLNADGTEVQKGKVTLGAALVCFAVMMGLFALIYVLMFAAYFSYP